ncbi:MAG: LemA family protein [Actinobacteria bacterium]|jgi:LemA protein|nr:LemA family protein [Actinomycetota bacterium]MDA2951405.1 LemA family protein [Actinomycetota bacterium]MDA2998751.1 LemA family protein [Actinomycetota bacterium]
MNSTLLIIVVVVILVLAIGGVYNSLIRRRNEVDNAWSQIDVQLKRRLDLIPNLVETVKGYAAHEKTALEAVVAARNSAMAASSDPHAQAAADTAISGALRQLFALSEAYPDLKANQGFVSLQEELANTESRIAYARQFYGDAVATYNTAIQNFPAVFIARAFSFTEREFFEAEDAARVVPEVKF